MTVKHAHGRGHRQLDPREEDSGIEHTRQEPHLLDVGRHLDLRT